MCIDCSDMDILVDECSIHHMQGTPGAPGGYYTAIPVPVYPPAEAPISIEGAIASQPVQVHCLLNSVC